MNTISRKISGSLAVTISKQAVERLDSYKPKGCPHSDYTLLDLLRDFIQAYSWKIDRGHTMSLSDFERIATLDNTQCRNDCRVTIEERISGWMPCWE